MSRARDIVSALPPALARQLGGHQGLADAASNRASPENRFATGMEPLDRAWAGGLDRGAVHEMLPAADLDSPAATGFALGLALCAAADRPLICIQQEAIESELGMLNGAGLAAYGADPKRVTFVRVADQVAGLRAARESLRCGAIGAVLVQMRGRSAVLNLTATRRLALTAAETDVPLFLVLHGAEATPSAAATRWRVAAAPSRALEANAPGAPAFAITLIRHRAGIPAFSWQVEWACDHRSFADPAGRTATLDRATAPLSRFVAPPAPVRAAAA